MISLLFLQKRTAPQQLNTLLFVADIDAYGNLVESRSRALHDLFHKYVDRGAQCRVAFTE